MESQNPKNGLATKVAAGNQFASESTINRPMKPSPSSEQLVLPASASQMLHKMQRF